MSAESAGHPMLTTLLWIAAALFAYMIPSLVEFDLWMGLLNKLIGMISFTTVIVINFPKVTEIIKKLFKKSS